MEIKDHEWCAILGIDGAFCVRLNSGIERNVTKDEWEAMSRGWVAGSPEAWGNIKESLDKLCSETNKCTYEIEENIKRISGMLERASEKVEESKPIPLMEPECQPMILTVNPPILGCLGGSGRSLEY